MTAVTPASTVLIACGACDHQWRIARPYTAPDDTGCPKCGSCNTCSEGTPAWHAGFVEMSKAARWVDDAPMRLKRLGAITCKLTGVRRMEYSSVGGEFDDA